MLGITGFYELISGRYISSSKNDKTRNSTLFPLKKKVPTEETKKDKAVFTLFRIARGVLHKQV